MDTNYILPSVSRKLDHGHINAKELLQKIKNHDGSEAYHSVFDMEKRPSFTGYRGPHQLAMGWFVLDFDSSKIPGHETLYNIDDAREELKKVWSHWQLSEAYARIFFSGQKGFHLYIREELFNIAKDSSTAHKYAQLTSNLKAELDLKTIDEGLMGANHKIRMPRSIHPRSGLYKKQLSLTQFESLSVDEIIHFAKNNGPVNLDGYTLDINKTIQNQKPHELQDFGLDTNPVADDGELFKAYKEKICIGRMMEGTFNEGERHGIAAILISDLFHTGLSIDDTTRKMAGWAKRQGIDDLRFSRDFERMISEQYEGKREYSYGCYHNIKKKFCSGTCGLYSKLSKEKRADVADVIETDTKVDAPEIPGERQLAKLVLDGFKGCIVKQDKDLFLYRSTHWVEASQADIDAIKEMLFVKLGRKAKSKDMESAFKTFLHVVPAVPAGVNLYEVHPDAANFKNGTLWITRKSGSYSLQFKSHRKEDFLTACLDVDYTPHSGSENKNFSEYLEHMLKNDPEREQKMRALKQIAGAMLMPKFPQIFFLLGESGSGKSTFVKLFYRLIGGSKVCGFVQPKDMHGFQLEGLIHKTINIHTDVDEHERISDSFLKASGDRIPIQINRKGRKVVQSLLPAVHVFCANNLPPTQVKNQHVYNRRVTIIKVDRVIEKAIDQFEDLVFEESTQALVAFALEGLRDLVQSGGFYYKPESSREQTKDWQAKGSDTLTDYLDDLSHGPVHSIIASKDRFVDRAKLFESYKQWSVDEGHPRPPITRAVFYRELKDRGYLSKKVNGQRVIEGFSSAEIGGSSIGGTSAPEYNSSKF